VAQLVLEALVELDHVGVRIAGDGPIGIVLVDEVPGEGGGRHRGDRGQPAHRGQEAAAAGGRERLLLRGPGSGNELDLSYALHRVDPPFDGWVAPGAASGLRPPAPARSGGVRSAVPLAFRGAAPI